MASTDAVVPAAPRLICAFILFALKWTFLLLVASFVLNLSALHKEEEALRPMGKLRNHHLVYKLISLTIADDLYDIGFEQLLYLR